MFKRKKKIEGPILGDDEYNSMVSGNTVTNADLARAFTSSILKMMAIKWAIIIGMKKLAKRALEEKS